MSRVSLVFLGESSPCVSSRVSGSTSRVEVQAQEGESVVTAGVLDVDVVDESGAIPIASAVLLIDDRQHEEEADEESEHFQQDEDTHDETTTSPNTTTFLRLPGEMMGLPAGQTVLYRTIESCSSIEQQDLEEPQQQQQPHLHTITHDGTSSPTMLRHLGRSPQSLDCPLCHGYIIQTITEHRISNFAIFASLFIIMIPPIFWLFWVPLVLPACKVTRHYCPKCHQRIGETGPCG